MKRMTKKQFMEQYVRGIRNFMSHGQLKMYSNEISFCPEHNLFEFLLPYKFPCYAIYNKRKDATLLFFCCTGIINLDFCNDGKEGIVMAFHGKYDLDDLVNDLSKSKKFLNLLKEEYFKYKESIIDKDPEEEAEKEEVHKSFEDFSEALKKVEESMGA